MAEKFGIVISTLKKAQDKLIEAGCIEINLEIIASAFIAIQEDPSLSVGQALEIAFQEWDI